MKRLLFLSLFFAVGLSAQPTAITNVRLFDGTKVIPLATVVIDGSRIVAAGANVAVRAGAKAVLFCGPDKGAVDFAIDEVRLK
ncbi:MAG: hypothetical protein ACRD3J_17700 [Thermoanaerobaculia bacterium]